MAFDPLRYTALFDYISPLLGLVNTIMHPGDVGFRVEVDACWGPGELRRMLKEKGIEARGLDLGPYAMTFTVPKEKAAWTERVLGDYGIPYNRGR